MLVRAETLAGLAQRWRKCFLQALAGVSLYLSPGSRPSKRGSTSRRGRGWMEAERSGEGAAPGPWEGRWGAPALTGAGSSGAAFAGGWLGGAWELLLERRVSGMSPNTEALQHVIKGCSVVCL